jgi:hypothetical protein
MAPISNRRVCTRSVVNFLTPEQRVNYSTPLNDNAAARHLARELHLLSEAAVEAL